MNPFSVAHKLYLIVVRDPFKVNKVKEKPVAFLPFIQAALMKNSHTADPDSVKKHDQNLDLSIALSQQQKCSRCSAKKIKIPWDGYAKWGNTGMYQLALQTLTVHAGKRQWLCSQLLLHSYFQVKLDVIHVSQYVLHVGASSLCPHTRNISSNRLPLLSASKLASKSLISQRKWLMRLYMLTDKDGETQWTSNWQTTMYATLVSLWL